MRKGYQAGRKKQSGFESTWIQDLHRTPYWNPVPNVDLMLALTQYPSMKIFIPDTRQRLAAEMEELIKRQRDALQASSLPRMTSREAEAYDERQKRIRDLFEALNRLRTAA
jgi:hypothetical protein